MPHKPAPPMAPVGGSSPEELFHSITEVDIHHLPSFLSFDSDTPVPKAHQAGPKPQRHSQPSPNTPHFQHYTYRCTHNTKTKRHPYAFFPPHGCLSPLPIGYIIPTHHSQSLANTTLFCQYFSNNGHVLLPMECQIPPKKESRAPNTPRKHSTLHSRSD